MLKENYEEVQKKITEACKRAGRNREEVTLIAVSKTKPVSMIEELLPGNAVNVYIEEKEDGTRTVRFDENNA